MAVKGGGKLSHEDKIALLLKKAETTTPEEAEALTAKAIELMQKYGITQALLNSRSTGEKERIEKVVIPLKGIYAKAYMTMMHAVAVAYGTRAYYTRWKQSDIDLTIVGFESDVAQLKVLLASLQLQVVVALSTWVKDNQEALANATNMEKFKARREFIGSFGYGAATRISRARASAVKESESTTPGTALVLRDRETAIDDFIKETVKFAKSRGNREKPGGLGSSSAGYMAGKNANTGDKQVGNRRALDA